MSNNIDNKALSLRRLSKDSSATNSSSSLLYYGGSAGSVPFRWESRPGTPKHPSSSSSLIPPLTPPPSFHSKPSMLLTPDHSGRRRTKPNVMASILSKLSLPPASPRPRMSPTSSVSSSSSSSSSSSWSPSKINSRYSRRRNSEVPLAFRFDEEDDVDNHMKGHHEEEEEEYLRPPSPTSTLSFGMRRSGSARGSRYFRGCYPVKSMTNALCFSIVGHRGGL